MAWISDHLKMILSLAAIAGMLAGAGAWVARAEEQHKDAREVESLAKSNARLLQELVAQKKAKEAVEAERERIRECLKEGKKVEDCT